MLTKDPTNIKYNEDNIDIISVKTRFGFYFPKYAPDIKYPENIVCSFAFQLMPWLLTSVKSRGFILWGIGSGKDKIGNWMRRIILRRSIMFLAYMPDGRKLAIESGTPSKYLINSVFANSDKSLFKKGYKLAFMGSLDQRKRLDVLLEAFDLLVKSDNRWSLEIIGDGAAYDSCFALATSLEIHENVTFHGTVYDDAQKRKILSGSLAMVLPGQAGLSVLESQAMGLPVITYKNAISGGEIDNIVHRQTGLLASTLSPIEFALLIKSLSNDPIYAKNISDKAIDHFRSIASGPRMANRFHHAATKAFEA